MIDRWADRLGTLLEPGIRAVIILLLAWLALRVARLVIRRGVARLLSSRRATDREFATRLRTLTSLAESATRLIVWILAGLTILAVFGVPIGPLLASAGVAGLAVGLGAQTLIRDIIGGIFIVLEDQFHVGDVITVNAISGQVESLTLRYTALRTLDGAYVVIPNGEIRIVQNLSRDWARAVIDVAVTPEEDVDRVVAVLCDLLGGTPERSGARPPRARARRGAGGGSDRSPAGDGTTRSQDASTRAVAGGARTAAPDLARLA